MTSTVPSNSGILWFQLLNTKDPQKRAFSYSDFMYTFK